MSDSQLSYPDKLEIVPLAKPPHTTVTVPGSKSITNRALVLAALTARGFGCTLRGVLQSEDTEVMIEALRALGFRVLTEWPESVVCVSSGADEPLIPATTADLFVANSGTTMRFLTALVSLGHGRFRLDGIPRMRERPIGDLLFGLQQLDVSAHSERDNNCPPVVVEANGLRGGLVSIKGDVSSQFLSALLLVAPFSTGRVTIEVEGPLVSWPYVFMTVQMLRRWGLWVRHPDDLLLDCALLLGKRCEWGEQVTRSASSLRFEIPGAQYQVLDDQRELAQATTLREGLDPRHVWLRDYQIEPDASAASYFLAAAAVSGGEVTVAQLPKDSLQGDVRFAEVLADMGCDMAHRPEGLTVTGGRLAGMDVDMNDISDTVMTLAAVACFADGPTTIRNVAHIRHKETDRLAALAAELRRLGAEVDEFADGLTITPRPLHGSEVETYNDHRMAMSLALIGLLVPGVVIKNPACVAKTYPRFFEDLEKLRC
ncbi:MAG: 3-phosphoshikimate 1-carboxyvinyltransferase [Gemmataceae bacterium]|nr:3-phosphoshikimate 1-carboxyvinyltransferase [Gemmataceae bacterium]